VCILIRPSITGLSLLLPTTDQYVWTASRKCAQYHHACCPKCPAKQPRWSDRTDGDPTITLLWFWPTTEPTSAVPLWEPPAAAAAATTTGEPKQCCTEPVWLVDVKRFSTAHYRREPCFRRCLMEFREPSFTKVSVWHYTYRSSPVRDWIGSFILRTAITTTTTKHRIWSLISCTDSESNTANVGRLFRHISVSDDGLSSAFGPSINAARPSTG